MKEVWKDIQGYEGIYQISNFGRVKSLKFGKEKILKTPTNTHNYPSIYLKENGKKKALRVHRLVAQNFLVNDNNYPDVNHIDGNKTNNKIENLEWCNRSQNEFHAYKIGLKNNNHKKGEKSHRTNLTNNDAKLIYKLRNEYKMKGKTLAWLFNVHIVTIYEIATKRGWKHIHEGAI